jgi:tellurite resistance protein TehA-like permease
MGTERTNLSRIGKNFPPAWFAVVLGTGGLANVLFQLSGKVLFLKPIAGGLLWLNAFLYVILIVPWIARWFTHLVKFSFD